MSQVEIADAARNLGALVERARSGEEVTLVEGGRELARIVPADSAKSRQVVRLGLAQGQFTVPDDFDAPLPDDILDLFYNGPLFPAEPTSGDER